MLLIGILLVLIFSDQANAFIDPGPETLINRNLRLLTGKFELNDIRITVHNDNGAPGTKVRDNAEFGTAGVLGLGTIIGFGDKSNFGIYSDILFTSDSTDEIDMNLLLWNSGFIYGSPVGRSEDHPQGKVYPYLGLGFVFANADVKTDFSAQLGSEINDFITGFGWEWKAGVIAHITRNIALTAEYRAIDASLDGDESSSKGVDFDLKRSQYLLGINIVFSNRTPERKSLPMQRSVDDL